ncbi:hypothetical protein F8388_006019 [Cannabis sativa]|uniref:Reverse transcriptase zinc-binding domain-containing protein n=1 Tax=Cannabis sativa TaxID=3483 RepID=A0A7J6IAV3_CANSA|nr:hypothetical protein F8388_006019 [Cannabis sativa]KAF4404723.1 hypothetical protein G4B88_006109 [Cannabis sativa]
MEQTSEMGTKLTEYHKLPAICFHCGHLAHCYGKCDRPLEYACPPIGKAVPLYGAWIKVGVPIKNCFDPAILRMKVPEIKQPYAVEKPPEEGRGKGKMVMLEDESDGSEARRQWPESQRPVGVRLSPKQKMVHGAKKACLREQEKMNNLGNMRLRKACVNVIPVITLGEEVHNLGDKTPQSPVTLLPILEVETFTPGSFSRNGESSKRKSSARGRGRGSAGSRRGTKWGSRSAGSRLVEKGKTINEARDNNSAFWKGILGSADIIRKGAMTLIGRGDTIDIWKQPWIPWLDYCDFLNLMNQVRPRFPNLRSIADITLDNGNWNMTLLKEMFGDSVGDRIGRIACLPLDNRDVVVWKEANDGMFTVKRGFEASQGNGQRVESKLWKKIWSSSVHFRHSIMLWRVISDCLPTRERLVFLQDKTCSMCGEATESNTHIFWDCLCARALWFSSPFSIRGGIGFDWSIKDRLEWLLDRNPSEHSASFLSFVGCLFKGIWKARNELLFKGGVVNIQQIRNSIMRRYSESFLSMEADAALDATTPGAVSRQTICNNVEVFYVSDASWKEDKAGLAVGLLDRQRNKTEWFAKQVAASSAAETELLAIQWAMQLAVQRGFKNYAAASDAKLFATSTILKRNSSMLLQNVGYSK